MSQDTWRQPSGAGPEGAEGWLLSFWSDM